MGDSIDLIWRKNVSTLLADMLICHFNQSSSSGVLSDLLICHYQQSSLSVGFILSFSLTFSHVIFIWRFIRHAYLSLSSVIFICRFDSVIFFFCHVLLSSSFGQSEFVIYSRHLLLTLTGIIWHGWVSGVVRWCVSEWVSGLRTNSNNPTLKGGEKLFFEKTVLPQAAQLPRTSAFF